MPENFHYSHFWAGDEWCGWRAQKGESPPPHSTSFSWHREAAAGRALQTMPTAAVASLSWQGCLWAGCGYSRRSLTTQDAVKCPLWSAEVGVFLCVRAVSRWVIPPGLDRDLSHPYLWDCEKVEAWYCNRLLSRGWCQVLCLVGWYQVIHKEWQQTLWCVGLKLNLCVVFLTSNEEIPSPSLSQYLSPFACFVFSCLRNMAKLSLLQFSQVDGHLAACSCISGIWDWSFECIVHRPLRSPHFIPNSPEAAAICVCSYSFPALTDQHQV